MRITIILLLFTLIVSSCSIFRQTPAPVPASRQEYIEKYSDIAVSEMERTGIPASIKLAQAILESGNGSSNLAKMGNNHFGIKCHDWTGKRIYRDDDEPNECFRRYSDPEESFLDHSEFLTGRPRYGFLFDLDPYDYEAWARGLQEAGYATNPNYANLLIRLIEENGLYKFDQKGERYSEDPMSPPERKSTIEYPEEEQRIEIFTRNRINYIVAGEGDTIESLARELDMKPWEFYLYNDLPREYEVQTGDILYLQPKRFRAERGIEEHIVGQGETMHCISQLYGVRLGRLLRRNGMDSDKKVEPGTVIKLR